MKKLKCFIVLFTFLFSMSSVIGQNWIPNYDEAQQKSKVEQKNLLINFSGSDWCVPCIKMKKNIFSNADFVDFSNQNLVLYNADFPRSKKKQPTEKIVEINKQLAEKYNTKGSFPFTILLNSEGKILKSWEGYANASAQKFVSEITQL